MNAHDKVIDQVLAALLAVPPLAGGNVSEEEQRMHAEDVAEFIVVRFNDSVPGRGTIRGAPVDWLTTFSVECHARSDERGSAGRASRRLHKEAFGRLMGDPTLGGVVMDLQEPHLTSDQTQRDSDMGCLIAQYVALHRTQYRTLEAP